MDHERNILIAKVKDKALDLNITDFLVLIPIIGIVLFIWVIVAQPINSQGLVPKYEDCSTVYYTYVINPNDLKSIGQLKRIATFSHSYEYSSFKYVMSQPTYMLFEAMVCDEPH